MRNLPYDLRILNNSDLKKVNGGILQAAIAIGAFVLTCAYYIGYQRGKASCSE